MPVTAQVGFLPLLLLLCHHHQLESGRRSQPRQSKLSYRNRARLPIPQQSSCGTNSPAPHLQNSPAWCNPGKTGELTNEQRREIQKHHTVAAGGAAGAVTSLTLSARLRNPKGSAQPCPTPCSEPAQSGTQRRMRCPGHPGTPSTEEEHPVCPRSTQNRGRAASTPGEHSEQEQNTQHTDESTRTAPAAGRAPSAPAAQESWGGCGLIPGGLLEAPQAP